jgi:hypothetical protein
MRIAFASGAALFAAIAILAPGAFADNARDNILKAEAQIQALNPADANAASPTDYQTAQTRLGEAKAAEARNKREESMWRSDEAAVQADIVQEKIKLRALDRTVSEIETGIETLRRELKS